MPLPRNRDDLNIEESDIKSVLDALNLILSPPTREYVPKDTESKSWSTGPAINVPEGTPVTITVEEREDTRPKHNESTAKSLIAEVVFDIRDALDKRGELRAFIQQEGSLMGKELYLETIKDFVTERLASRLTIDPLQIDEQGFVTEPISELTGIGAASFEKWQQMSIMLVENKAREIKAMPDAPTKGQQIRKIVTTMADEGMLTIPQLEAILYIEASPEMEEDSTRLLEQLESNLPAIMRQIRPSSGRIRRNFATQLANEIRRDSPEFSMLLPTFGLTEEEVRAQIGENNIVSLLTPDEIGGTISDDNIKSAIAAHLASKSGIGRFGKGEWPDEFMGAAVNDRYMLLKGRFEQKILDVNNNNPGLEPGAAARAYLEELDTLGETFLFDVLEKRDALLLAEQKKDPSNLKRNAFLRDAGYTESDFDSQFIKELDLNISLDGINSVIGEYERDFLASAKMKKINDSIAGATDEEISNQVQQQLQQLSPTGDIGAYGDAAFQEYFQSNIAPQIGPLIRSAALANPETFNFVEYTNQLLGSPEVDEEGRHIYREPDKADMGLDALYEEQPAVDEMGRPVDQAQFLMGQTPTVSEDYLSRQKDLEEEYLSPGAVIKRAIEAERAGQWLPDKRVTGPVTPEQFRMQMDPSAPPAPPGLVQRAIGETGAPFPGFPTGGQIYRPPPTELGFAERPELAEAIAGFSGGDTGFQGSIIKALPGLYEEFPEYAEEQRRQQRRDLEERLMGLGTRGIMEKPEVEEGKPEPEPPPGVEVDKLGRWRTPAAMGIGGIRGFARQKTAALPTKFDFLPFLESRIPGIRREYETSPGYLAEQQEEQQQQLADQLEIERQAELEKELEKEQVQQRSLRRGRTRIR